MREYLFDRATENRGHVNEFLGVELPRRAGRVHRAHSEAAVVRFKQVEKPLQDVVPVAPRAGNPLGVLPGVDQGDLPVEFAADLPDIITGAGEQPGKYASATAAAERRLPLLVGRNQPV